MPNPVTPSQALATLTPEPGLVVLMCGVAGSGKTTFSQALEATGFARLSIDEEIWATAGRYGIDYPAEDYGSRVEVGRDRIRERLRANLCTKTPTVVDSSFWSRAHRDEFKRVVEDAGCTWRLVYLQADEELLRTRIQNRSKRFDANAALPITDQALQRFLTSFQVPCGEGELVVAAGPWGADHAP